MCSFDDAGGGEFAEFGVDGGGGVAGALGEFACGDPGVAAGFEFGEAAVGAGRWAFVVGDGAVVQGAHGAALSAGGVKGFPLLSGL